MVAINFSPVDLLTSAKHTPESVTTLSQQDLDALPSEYEAEETLLHLREMIHDASSNLLSDPPLKAFVDDFVEFNPAGVLLQIDIEDVPDRPALNKLIGLVRSYLNRVANAAEDHPTGEGEQE